MSSTDPYETQRTINDLLLHWSQREIQTERLLQRTPMTPLIVKMTLPLFTALRIRERHLRRIEREEWIAEQSREAELRAWRARHIG